MALAERPCKAPPGRAPARVLIALASAVPARRRGRNAAQACRPADLRGDGAEQGGPSPPGILGWRADAAGFSFLRRTRPPGLGLDRSAQAGKIGKIPRA